MPLRVFLWAAPAIWLVGHALFHFWEVAAGICSASVIPRDFPAVTLPAIIGVALACWPSVTHGPEEPQPPEDCPVRHFLIQSCEEKAYEHAE